MTKDELHKKELERVTNNGFTFLLATVHFLMALLWIVGLLTVLVLNAVVIAIGVMLIITNIFTYFNNIRIILNTGKADKAWREQVKTELKDELRKDLLSLDLAA